MTKLDNFKGNIHTLTLTDRKKGGSVSSERKRVVNGLKNLKHGKYAEKYHVLLDCSSCPYVGVCQIKHNGFCKYLLKELSHNRSFRKQFIQCFLLDEKDIDPLHLVKLKIEMNKQYALHLKQLFE